MRHWVATLVVAAGDLGIRGKVLKKLIELADVLSDKLGNLVSFMAVMEGLSLPQVLFLRLVYRREREQRQQHTKRQR